MRSKGSLSTSPERGPQTLHARRVDLRWAWMASTRLDSHVHAATIPLLMSLRHQTGPLRRGQLAGAQQQYRTSRAVVTPSPIWTSCRLTALSTQSRDSVIQTGMSGSTVVDGTTGWIAQSSLWRWWLALLRWTFHVERAYCPMGLAVETFFSLRKLEVQGWLTKG